MRFRAEHIFKGIDLNAYETLYFDEAFNIAMCKAVKLARTLVKLDEKAGRIERAVKVGPDREIPPAVAKVLGVSRIEYTEHVAYTRGSYRGIWHTVSSVFTDKVESRGNFSFEAVPGGVKRIVEGEIKVKVFGVGGLIERFIVADVERSYDDAAKFTELTLQERSKA